jgi:hypothetical protein
MLLLTRTWASKGWTAGTVVACALLLWSNTVYLDFSAPPRFLLEKGSWAQQPWWLAAFYFHIVGASVCLASGLPLMFPAWTKKHPRWHRVLGYFYFNAVLWMAAPAGLLLALVAKGGVWGVSGFLLAGVLWWQTTWCGYRAIRRGDVEQHIRWMIRSFAWALSAPAFRIIQVALYLVGLDNATNYLVSLWLSLAVSVWLAESCLWRSRRGTSRALALSLSPGGVSS